MTIHIGASINKLYYFHRVLRKKTANMLALFFDVQIVKNE